MAPMPSASANGSSSGSAERSISEYRGWIDSTGSIFSTCWSWAAEKFEVPMCRTRSCSFSSARKKLLKGRRAWEVRSAGQGSKGERWYAWAWLGTSSPGHSLLVRHHLKTGELAFHYCHVPDGQLASKARLIRAAGLRWPVEESFELGKGCFGLDQCQARLYTAVCGTSRWSRPCS